jgi:hypothetical protein
MGRHARTLTAAAASLLGVAVLGVSGQQPGDAFVDATAQSALQFVHVNGAAGELLLPEVIGAGGALFDYDNDGDLDVFAVQGASLPPARGVGLAAPAVPVSSAPRSRLFRNDGGAAGGAGGDRGIRFTDVTERSGIVAIGSGMGAATGDYDNDGWSISTSPISARTGSSGTRATARSPM